MGACALFFYQKILNQDPLGMILEKLNVIKVKDDLVFGSESLVKEKPFHYRYLR